MKLIGPIAGGAGRVLLVVGSQKIVPNLEMAIQRIKSHVFPYADARLREPVAGRTRVFLVREPVGV